MKTLNTAFDVETTGYTPITASICSLGMAVADESYNPLGEYYELCNVAKNRFETNVFGREVDMWPEQAQKVHGITFEEQLKAQSPIEMLRKLYMFLEQWPDHKINLIYHANGGFDIKFLLYHAQLHAPKMYSYLMKRIGTFEYMDACKDGEYTTGVRADNTMAMARAYIKSGSDALKMAQKYQKIVDKNRNLIYKDRKTPAKPEKIAEWRDKMAQAENDMALLQGNDVAFDGVSLDKLTRALGIEHDHHSAISDSRVLLPIHKFLKERL